MEVVWVDNASTEDKFEQGKQFWIDTYKKLGLSLSVYTMKNNVGFQAGINFGVEKSVGNMLCITQPDVVFSDDKFLTSIRESGSENNLILGGRLIDWDGGWNRIDVGKKKYIVPYLEGWLLIMNRSIWNDVGGFDLRYFPADMEDVDFSLAALKKGYSLAEVLPKVFMHIGGTSFLASKIDGTVRAERTIENKQKFIDKWASEIQEIFNT